MSSTKGSRGTKIRHAVNGLAVLLEGSLCKRSSGSEQVHEMAARMQVRLDCLDDQRVSSFDYAQALVTAFLGSVHRCSLQLRYPSCASTYTVRHVTKHRTNAVLPDIALFAAKAAYVHFIEDTQRRCLAQLEALSCAVSLLAQLAAASMEL